MTAIAGVDIAALADRVKKILIKPEAEWDKISAETPQLQDLFIRYVAILAAIFPVCHFVGGLAFGYSVAGQTVRPDIGFAIVHLVLFYVLSFVCVGLTGLIVEFLAPHFGGQTDRISAFKLVCYSMTAGWVAGVFGLVPALSILGVLGFYSIYLFYLGAPKLARIPADKAGTFTAVVFIASAIVGGIAQAILLHTLYNLRKNQPRRSSCQNQSSRYSPLYQK
jgi:hypothetical protein